MLNKKPPLSGADKKRIHPYALCVKVMRSRSTGRRENIQMAPATENPLSSFVI
jgi:hypothetical protein